ncbi:MAG: alpha/beta fold hydrolase [Pseudomonadota bacterium]
MNELVPQPLLSPTHSSSSSTERLASPWLGTTISECEERPGPSPILDRLTKTWLGHFTANLSPASLINAYVDWMIHLGASPSKQHELTVKALRKSFRLMLYMLTAAPLHDGACIDPLPQDKRFSDPAWQQWPYNLMYQGFLLTQQWWHNATMGTRGVSKHHEDVVTFAARQFLDMLSPSNFLLTNPVVLSETLKSGGENLVRGLGYEFEDRLRDFTGTKAEGAEAFVVGKNVGVTEGKVVLRTRVAELIQYSPTTESVYATPVLIVPAWIMKYYVLDLSPHNSLVKYLVDRGHTVFMISWKNPGKEDRDLSMDDYRRAGVMQAIDAIGAITGSERINAVGYCLGGTLLAIAAAAMAQDGDTRLESISFFTAQVDFEEPGELSLFIDESQVTFLEDVMAHQGYLDSRQMAGAFQMLRSNDLIWSRRLRRYLLGQKESMNDLMTWNADATRMPFRMHAEYLRQLFLNNELAEGRYCVDGRMVALTDIRSPIFAVATMTDHVAPWRSAYKIHLLTDTDVTFLLTSGGHNAGIVSPPGHPNRFYQMATRHHGDPHIDPDTWQSRALKTEGSWWPAWQAWLAERSGKRVGAPEMGNAKRGYTVLDDAPGRYVLEA